MPTYATVQKVKDIIKTGRESHNILADNAVDEVILQHESNRGQVQDNKDMIFAHEEVDIGNNFFGSTILKIQFNSSTDFDVYEVQEGIQNLRLISQSNSISNDWSHPNKGITIKSAAWGGTIEQNDIVKLKLRAYLSEKMLETRVEDTEVMIDSKLKGAGVKLTQNASDNTSLFQTGGVPDEISVACKYLTAYYVYTDVYKDKFQDNSGDDFSYVKRWKRRAENLIETYMDEQTNIAPKIGSFPPIIDTRGVDDGMGPGYQEFQESDEDVDIGWQEQFGDWY